MITADTIFLIAMGAALLIGAIIGFGKVFKLAITGIVGYFFALFFAYIVANLMYNFEFIQNFEHTINDPLRNMGNWFGDFLANLRIDFIIVTAVLFVIFALLRKIIGKLVQSIMEVDNTVMKVINHITGAIGGVALAFAIMLIVFQVIFAANAGIEGSFYQSLNNSFFKLDVIFANNPFKAFWVW